MSRASSASSSSSSTGWWDRWFRKRPPVQAAPRGRRAGSRTARRGAAAASVPSVQPPSAGSEATRTPATFSCPAIVVEPVSEESSEWLAGAASEPAASVSSSRSPGPGVVVPPAAAAAPPTADAPATAAEVQSTPEDSSRSHTPVLPLAIDVSLTPEDKPPDNAAPAAAATGSFENANKVILRTDSPETPPSEKANAEEVVAEAVPDPAAAAGAAALPSPAAAANAENAAITGDRLGEFRTALEGITSFSYATTKEQKKISVLAADAQQLLDLWRDALDKKDVLSNLIRECTDAVNQASTRLSADVHELELLYRELSEALGNLRRVTDSHAAVRHDTHTMRKVVSNATVKEQAQVSKVASQHEKEVYNKWQTLKSSVNTAALEELHNELTDKQRAISGLDALVRRRLQQVEGGCNGGDQTPETPVTAAATARRSGKPSPQRAPASPGRRNAAAGTGRTPGKRKLAEERGERKSTGNSVNRNLMMIRYQGGGGGGASTSTSTATTSTASTTTGASPPTPPYHPSMPSPPIPPPPPPPPPLMFGLSAAAAADGGDEDSNGAADTADETSTSPEDQGLDTDEALALAAVFPMQFSAAMFDSLQQADSAEAMVEAMRFD